MLITFTLGMIHSILICLVSVVSNFYVLCGKFEAISCSNLLLRLFTRVFLNVFVNLTAKRFQFSKRLQYKIVLICITYVQVVNKVGRRNMVILITTICGLCGIAVNLVPNIFASGILFLIFLVGFVVISLYMAIAVALFPTHLR